MSINQRLFGTPITGSVRDELDDRQTETTVTKVPGTSIASTHQGFNLSEHTPFIRMWTSVKLMTPADIDHTLEKVFETTNNMNWNKVTNEEFAEIVEKGLGDKQTNYGNKKKKYYDEIMAEHENAGVVAIDHKDENQKVTKKSFYFVMDKTQGVRDQIDTARQIYVIGDYNYQEKYGSVDANTSLKNPNMVDRYKQLNWKQGTDTAIGNESAKDKGIQTIFPQELKKNPLLKPQSGITGLTSETEGVLGTIKKTRVKFTVHNFYDYDKIYNKYFLKPGATIFVDFGWSTIKNLYDPEDLITSSDIQEYLYDETKGIITKGKGNLEVLKGIVTDYNSKILPNGSVDCEVTLTSSNSALLSLSIGSEVSGKIQALMHRGIYYYGVRELIDDVSEDPAENSNLKKLITTPNQKWTAVEYQNYLDNLTGIAQKELSGNSGGSPGVKAQRTGVFIDSLNAESSFISWGLFEDLIINQQFGFGKSAKDFLKKTNSEVVMDSSNSYTKLSKQFKSKQKLLSMIPDAQPDFLYPLGWGSSPDPGSYNSQKKKLPKEHVSYEDDLDRNRIPLREIFIKTDLVKDVFNQHKDVRKTIELLLDKLNKSSHQFFKLKLVAGDTDDEIKVIDVNYVDSEEGKDVTVYEDKEKELFTFKIFQPGSIVKDYDLSFKLPSGNIGNMYAIQAMGHDSTLFSLNLDVDTAKAINSVDPDALSVIYEPDVGNYRLEQSLNLKPLADDYSVFNAVESILSTDSFNAKTSLTGGSLFIPNMRKKSSYAKNVNSGTTSSNSTKRLQNLKKRNENALIARGLIIAPTIPQYFDMVENVESTRKDKSNLLPFELSLNVYGIGSIVPGDTFRVDYLPKMYLKNTYVQTMKVIHNVNSDGWFTNLETQFRLNKFTNKYGSGTNVNSSRVRLSVDALNTLGITEAFTVNDGYFTDSVLPLDVLQAHITDLTLNLEGFTTKNLNYGYGIDFKTIDEFDEDMFKDGIQQNGIFRRQRFNIIGGRGGGAISFDEEMKEGISNWMSEKGILDMVSLATEQIHIKVTLKPIILKTDGKYQLFVDADGKLLLLGDTADKIYWLKQYFSGQVTPGPEGGQPYMDPNYTKV